MTLRLIAGTAALAVAATGAVLTAPSAEGAPTPANPGPRAGKSAWTEADEAGSGTARTRRGDVWLTLQGGLVADRYANG